MGVPQVAVVGRPNVGKSSLFNWLVNKRLAIVDDTAGVTRDRMTFLMCVADRYFELVDTGGMGIEDVDNLTEHVRQQIEMAIESASVILFVVDSQTGITPLDQEVVKRLRSVSQSVPILCVANKTDSPTLDAQAAEFYKLGFGRVIRTSVKANRGREELLDAILKNIPENDQPPPVEAGMKAAIVGRRNTGKSTFVNSLAHTERMIVSEVAGTTRDSVDVRFELDGKSFIAIDTPGLRRTKSINTDIDFYSMHRAQRSIRRADVVLLFFDAAEPISKVDKQLCEYIAQQYRPCIFVVNKWDLYAGKVNTEEWVKYLHDTFRAQCYVPIAFVTGQTGKNVKTLLNHAQMLFKQARTRVGTGDLNRLLRASLEKNPPPLVRNSRPKIYYATQVGTEPPTVVLFCSNPKAITQNYQRYLLGVMRDHLPFGEVPIKLYLRTRKQSDGSQVPDPPAFDVPENEVASDMLEGD
ncbi:MAG TPA: ribosome biogenesis GTPase Der [Pirellulales bacterium]